MFVYKVQCLEGCAVVEKTKSLFEITEFQNFCYTNNPSFGSGSPRRTKKQGM